MNYLGPRQRQSTGRWDYTNHNDRTGTYALGYCRPWADFTKEELIAKWGEGTGSIMFKEHEKSRAFKDSHHADGHATADEATACYKRYQLDHQMRISKIHNSLRKCEVCETWTDGMVCIGGYASIILCPDHQGREHVEKLYQVGTSVES